MVNENGFIEVEYRIRKDWSPKISRIFSLDLSDTEPSYIIDVYTDYSSQTGSLVRYRLVELPDKTRTASHDIKTPSGLDPRYPNKEQAPEIIHPSYFLRGIKKVSRPLYIVAGYRREIGLRKKRRYEMSEIDIKRGFGYVRNDTTNRPDLTLCFDRVFELDPAFAGPDTRKRVIDEFIEVMKTTVSMKDSDITRIVKTGDIVLLKKYLGKFTEFEVLVPYNQNSQRTKLGIDRANDRIELFLSQLDLTLEDVDYPTYPMMLIGRN